ncbi:MAG: ferrous iron transport protein A [Candidatus Omnitrophica bacterium]|nr:ferrous iron transport protein A [Candidatus Omnitrophota bacterium]
MIVDLTKMHTGESGVIEDIHGGHGVISRLQSMGIRPGKKMTKVSSHFWRGPQTIKIDKLRLAIGFGMAKKIFINVKR